MQVAIPIGPGGRSMREFISNDWNSQEITGKINILKAKEG